MLKDSIIDYLVKNNFKINISLDGPKIIHDKYRRTIKDDETFIIVSNNVKRLYKRYPKYFKENIMFISTLAPPYDYTKIDCFFSTNPFNKCLDYKINAISEPKYIFCDIYEVDENEGIDSYYKLFEKYKYMLENNLYDNELYRIVRSIFDQEFSPIHNRKMTNNNDVIYPNAICIPGIPRLNCSTVGDFYPCERISENLKIGNIHTGLNSDTIYSYCENYINLCEKMCYDCFARNLCKICFTSVIKNCEINIEQKEKSCETYKKILDNNIQKYLEIMDKNPNSFNYLREKFSIFNYEI